MCNTCKQYGIHPNFHDILHQLDNANPGLNRAEQNETLSTEYPVAEYIRYNRHPQKTQNSHAGYTSTTRRSSYISQQPISERQLITTAIAGGERNENVLTDLLFFKRHPELNGSPLSESQPNFNILSKEWISIRDTFVRPVLNIPSSPAVSQPANGNAGTGVINLQNMLKAMQRKNYVIYTKPYQLNIVGVRANTATPNSFDDSINVFYKDKNGGWQFKSNPATTDPGTYYLNNPMNVNGTAIVVPGQYINSHKIGLHKNEYTALVQQGNITVTRDFNKDNKLNFKTGREETGFFGINIHKAGTSSTIVDKWSAGCQVFARSSDFDSFISLCRQHSNLYGNNFTYTLLEEGDLV